MEKENGISASEKLAPNNALKCLKVPSKCLQLL